MSYRLIQSGSNEFFETSDGRAISTRPLAVLDELNRLDKQNNNLPSRLEIAAMVLQGFASDLTCEGRYLKLTAQTAIKWADALIAAEKEVAK